MKKQLIKFLNSEDLKKCLSMEEAISAMKDAFIQLSTGKAKVPVRMQMDIPEHDSTEFFMPVYSVQNEKIGLKVVSLNKNNLQLGLPLIHAIVLLFDGRTGQPVAIMDGEYLTALRTGAASGLATDLLANPDAGSLALFGAGVQSRTQLEAVAAVRQIEKVYLFSRDQQKAADFAKNMGTKLNLEISVSQDDRILKEVDIICAATTSATPLFKDKNLKPGVHINGVGSFKPDMQEIPAETVMRAKLVVDQREAALKEAGDIIIPLQSGLFGTEHIYAELGEIAAGIKAGRVTDSEITFFKSVGNAVQDLVAASRILENANRLNLGSELFL